MSRPIEDYGLIGNMLSAALVARDGSIDWLCLPHFNSPACFASLLGDETNGHWQLMATDPDCTVTRRYVPATAVLETRLHTATGIVTVFDFMPLSEDEGHVDVVRMVRGDMGHVEMHTELVLRFNYGQAVPWVRRRDYGLSAVSGPDAVELHTPIRLHGKEMKSVATFVVKEGEMVPFTLSYHRSHQRPHFVPDRAESLQKTIDWWHHWASTCRVPTEDPTLQDAVVRSAITLKLLTFWPTGGIVAAPTTSLPEDLGGERNWDYRYCWLRDASLTLYALLNAGYREEAEAWREWLLRAASGHPDQLHIMYGISGERWLPETEVPWLCGYENSRPVRIGNDAVGQLQLDVYGEVIGALHTARAADLTPMREAWRLQRVMLRKLETIWDHPDNGIWEMRGPPRHFTYSRMMTWLAFDRAIQSAERFNLEGDLSRWRALRDTIHAEICERGFNAEIDSFTQTYGETALDASLLLMVKTGFLPANDPRLIGTVQAIERELLQDGLVMRYRTENGTDGLSGDEGAFLACSFWLVDAYLMQERHADARKLYDKLLSLRNDVGLLAEEYDTRAGRLVGNFPQAFSHVGLINSTYDLIDAHGPARQEADSTAPAWSDPQN
ncbi:MAG: glycoside hydrolase family 15 protein [Burkholderiaceae bacterium]|nr:glycoside hydrolase family 15 protein [Burkholderiaceae bacterium]